MDNRIKKIITGVLLIALTGLVSPVNAQLGNKGGYTTGAYSELDANGTYLERVSDWFATVGKSKEEKAVIKSQRRAARKINNAQRLIARKKKEIEKKKKKMMRELKKRENN
ncbi:MAG: hypothetical protein KAS66_09140 [Candidatus Omnitrophica bacterium]|nr:hypothetical protein [Candidatus Omnitrophota bacterium]